MVSKLLGGRGRLGALRAAVLATAAVVAGAGVAAQAAVAGTGRSAAETITTVAGGPGGPGHALSVGLSVCGVKFVRGALYFGGDGTVRRVNPRTGWLTTPVANWAAITANAEDVYLHNSNPCGVTVDSAANVLEAAGSQVKVVAARSGRFYGRRMRAGHAYVLVDKSGAPRVAGSPNGDRGPATAARLWNAVDVELDHAGNVIVTDAGGGGGLDVPPVGALVRVVAERTGRFYGRNMTAGDIYTVAGTTFPAKSGSSLATRTWLGLYIGVVRVDRFGNLVVSGGYDYTEPAISAAGGVWVAAERTGRFYGRNMTAGHMYPIAGNGERGGSGDGGPATKAGMACAAGLALDHDGNVIIADCGQVRVVAERSARLYGRRMTAGDIYAIAGYGTDRGNGGPAGRATVNAIGVTVDPTGNVILAQLAQIRLIAVRTGRGYGQHLRVGDIYQIAGTTVYPFGYSGDGGPATRAEFDPYSVTADHAGDLAIADPNYGPVRFVPATSGVFFGRKMTRGDIYTLARNIYSFYAPPQIGIAFDHAGNVLTANEESVQVVAAKNGTFYGQPMTTGHVYTIAIGYFVAGISLDSHGNVLMADSSSNMVTVLAATSGTFYGQPMTAGSVYTIAGTGQPGDTGNGGPATAATLNDPVSVTADHHGNVLIADSGGVRIVAGASGTFFGRHMTAGNIYTIAAGLYSLGLAVDAAGNAISAGGLGGVVQLIAARKGTFYGVHATTGHIYTIAGNRRSGYSGDGGPATRASLGDPSAVAIGPSGNVLIADWTNLRIRSVSK